MEKEGIKEDIKKINSFPNKLLSMSGAVVSITIITSILYLFKLIPLNIVISMGLFISLPIAFTFIFGIIINRPIQTWRHYGFLVYIITSFLLYLVFFTRPNSLLEGVIHSWHFLLGFIISVVAFVTYSIPNKILKNKSYRTRASISLGISLLITFSLTFILKHYKIFELIK